MGDLKYKYRNRQFWCRVYYVDTVGKNTKKIKEYIEHQLDEDRMSNQLTLEDIEPFNGEVSEKTRNNAAACVVLLRLSRRSL